MGPKILRTSLAAFLILLMAISLLPTSYAGPSQGASSQSTSGSRPRRGKNGAGGAGNQAPDQKRQQRTEPAQPAPITQPSALDNTNSASLSNEQVDTSQDEAEAEATEESTQNSTKPRRRKEPPPFDRPPLDSQSPQQGQKNSGGQSSKQGDRQSPNRDSGSAPSSTSDRSDDGSNHSTGGPPVLRRPADSRSGEQQSQGRPPVLRRPSDAEPEQENRSPRGVRPTAGQHDDGGDDTIRLDATLVNIPLLVSDRAGRYVPQLGKQDFLIYEDGVQQEVAFFGSEEVPFNVVLLLDMSPSVQGSVEAIHDASIAFVQQLRPQDRVMVVSFDRNVHFHTGFTSNRRELENAILSTSTGSGTSVYDAVYEVVDRRLRGIDGRKALILFSDGEDTTSSQASYDDAVDIVTESDVLVYGLRYPGTGASINVDPWPRRNPIPQIPFPIPWPWPWPRRRRGPFTQSNLQTYMKHTAVPSSTAPQSGHRRGRRGDFMADIASAGGGPVFDAEKIGDLTRLAHRIAEELRHVYMISYYPTNSLANGGYREIRIRVRGRDDLAIRHRRGYNAREVSRRPGT